jgi:hypothetical protein
VDRDSAILAARVRPIAATSALILLAAALPQPAAAQDDGVFFDPGGPSDKEYAVPHEQARSGGGTPSSDQSGGSGTASPGSGSGAQEGDAQGAPPAGDSSSAPLFGEGVSQAKGDRRAEEQVSRGGGGDRAVTLAPVSTETDAATGMGWFVAIAGGILLAGGGLAYLTRMRMRGAGA